MNIESVFVTNLSLLKPIHENEHPDYEYFKYPAVCKSAENHCCVSFYQILPGKSAYPYHSHQYAEEVFYLVSGRGTLRTEEGLREVSAGDLIVCPPGRGGAHKLTNTSEKDLLTYIDFDTVAFPEAVFYPDSDKVGIYLDEKENRIFRASSEVDYYEGE